MKRLLIVCGACLLVLGISGLASADTCTIPRTALAAHPELGTKAWGPGTLGSRTANADSVSVDWDLSGLTDAGTGFKDDFELSLIYGQTGLHNADFTDFVGSTLKCQNLDDEPIHICLFMNTGFTGSDPTADTFWQGEWVYLGPGEEVIVSLSFDYAQAYNISDNTPPHTQGTNENYFSINAQDRTEFTSFGVQFANFEGENSDGAATVRMTPYTHTSDWAPVGIMKPAAASSGLINCSQSTTIDFQLIPDDPVNGLYFPELRGYSARVQCSAELSFSSTDVTVHTVPTGVTGQSYVTQNGTNDYTIDYVILGGSTGMTSQEMVFSIDFHGAATGTGTVQITNASLGAWDGRPVAVFYPYTWSVDVDCTPPSVPAMDAEPAYTAGTSNTVSWSDESGSGAAEYYAECATDAGFASVVDNSDWVAATSHPFDGLTDGQIYYYHVKSRDALGNESSYSAAVFSTQDDTAPASSADAQPTYQTTLTFDVPYTASDATSGVASVELYYDVDGGGYNSCGTFTSSPILFTAGGDGTYSFYTVATDGVGNAEAVPDTPPDASTLVDATKPSSSVDDAQLDPFYVESFFDVYFDADDGTGGSGIASVELFYKKDSGSYTSYGTGTSPIHFDTSTTGGDGTYYFYTVATDNAGNIEDPPTAPDYDASTVVDTTAPSTVTNITAVRGCNKVTVNWTNPGSSDLASLEIWRGMWYRYVAPDTLTTYPEYDDWTEDVIPTRPADHDAVVANPEWVLAGEVTAPGTSLIDDDYGHDLERCVYYYEVFAKDSAGNYSAPAPANARATSYLLGDLDNDCDVTLGDVSVLGAAYGTVEGGGMYNAECDIGPTNDYSGSGIPETDNIVGFEDLMIFALNYDITVSKTPAGSGGAVAVLSWYKSAERTWSLVLSKPCQDLKGLQLSADVPADAVSAVAAGALLSAQEVPYFLQNVPKHGLDLGLAMLGGGASIVGEGELLRVLLSGDYDLSEIELVLRSTANEPVEFEFAATSGIPEIPTVYDMSANYPNPFNPMTKIRYDLPEPQLVRLVVYAVDGRRIATLVNEAMPAGSHEVTWQGRSDEGEMVASGIYFFRIEAGSFSKTGKMTLLK